MGSTPSPPPPPDPVATAAAQGQMNRETAVTQTGLNAINQYTPQGSLEYSQNGTWPDGTPRFNATTSLTPTSQGIFDTNQVTQQNIANIGKDQSARIGGLLGKPLQLGNDAVEGRIMDLATKRLNPKFATDEEALRTRLANSGIRVGSQAFNDEMNNLKYSQNDAINQLLLSGRSQANQELLTERNQPINEITALMSGSQVSNPTFQQTPTTGVAGVDYMGMVNNNYNNAVKNYQTEMSNSNAAMGGMFGLGGTLGSAAMRYGPGLIAMSDRRLKTNIKKIGKLPTNDLPVYSFNYKAGGPKQIGLMADEVAKKRPDAVLDTPSGYKAVDYDKAVQA